MQKRVGLLGGTFNPPHLGHLIIANEIIHALSLDEIRFMPNQEPPHKNPSPSITSQHRVEMLELAIKDVPSFKVEKIELERKGKSYTYETIQYLKKREPETDFYFIIGADMIEYLPKWHKIDELTQMIQFVGVNRPRYSQLSEYPVLLVETPDVDISSTMIRTRLREGKSVRFLVPDDVIKYMEDQRLYE
ncbi:nicotinate-nucleotide adenylyltransferase [Falsibacillus pallidus]|uniref:Probable nicotinate-nucleotide adenylyltransferase n=1 Tax=Falsibacillus pallidus TaxID=493781 RepID=A0A370GJT0_9BACI|nr:nicotinate-nucleotide adenylyltransferase [Falsibacillus pallidus]RDI44038.1 nicotinate-nucleotide adenylyltransferase [Falsibacillus pallidus]